MKPLYIYLGLATALAIAAYFLFFRKKPAKADPDALAQPTWNVPAGLITSNTNQGYIHADPSEIADRNQVYSDLMNGDNSNRDVTSLYAFIYKEMTETQDPALRYIDTQIINFIDRSL